MTKRPLNRFNRVEVARALRAARDAGEQPERVDIDPVTGKISVILTRPSDESLAVRAWDEATQKLKEEKKARQR
jgi:hypothetical protein